MNDSYESLRLRNQLCFPIYLCAKELVRRYTPLLDRLNLTYTQYVVMMYFWEKRESNLKELGETLLLDPSTLTPLIKKLEAKGYLTRERSARDERNLVIRVTEAGDRLQDEALDVPETIRGCIGLSPEEEEALSGMIYKVLMNVEKA